MQKFFLIVIAFGISMASFSQQTKKERKAEKKRLTEALINQEEEGVIAYRKHFLVGGKLTTSGYGIFFEMGRASSIKKGLLYQLEITEQKSHKELKVYNAENPVSSFVYGKENFVYPVKLGVQQQRVLGNKSNKNGVSIFGNYGGGLVLAFLRPYYVQLDDGTYIKYQADSATFINGSRIIGANNFSKGWDDMTITPGIYAKTSLRFDYGAYNEIVSALEIGLSAELYTKEISIMALNPSKQFFVTGYVAIMFGHRK
jgi:hypothetical protein